MSSIADTRVKRRMKYQPGDIPGPTEHGWIPITWWPFENEDESDDRQMFLVLYKSAPAYQCVCYIGWWEDGEPVWFSGEHRVTPSHWQPIIPFP